MSDTLFHFLHRSTPRLLTLTHRLVAAGIATAVAMLMITIAIMQGFWESYGTAARSFHGDIVLFQDPEGPLPEALMRAIRQDPDSSGIAAESPFILREGLLTGGNGVTGVVVKGIQWEAFARVHTGLTVRWEGDGEAAFTADSGSAVPVILGKSLDASQRPTQLFLPTAAHPDGESVPIQIVGTFASGLYDYDHQFIIVPFRRLQKLYRLNPDVVDGITLRLNQSDETWRLARKWQDDHLYATIMSWGELNYAMFDALRLQRTTFIVLMSLFVLIALSNVTGVVGLQVWFRRHEGAILRLLGMSRARLKHLIWRSAFKTAIVGVAAGTLMGIGGVAWLQRTRFIELPESVYFVNTLPVYFKWLWAGIIVTGVLTAAATVTAIAVARMAKMPVLKGLVRT